MKNKIALVLLATVFASRVAAYPLTPKNVANDIKQRGATAVIADLHKTDEYEKILNSIGLGEDAWIKIVPELKKGADSGLSAMGLYLNQCRHLF